jgi:hypothetical protein
VCVCVIINGPEKHDCARLSPPAHGALRICAARGGVGTMKDIGMFACSKHQPMVHGRLLFLPILLFFRAHQCTCFFLSARVGRRRRG